MTRYRPGPHRAKQAILPPRFHSSYIPRQQKKPEYSDLAQKTEERPDDNLNVILNALASIRNKEEKDELSVLADEDKDRYMKRLM